MTLPEVHGFGRHKDLHTMRWMDHSAWTSSAIRCADVVAHKRTVISPLIRLIFYNADGAYEDIGLDTSGSATTKGANTTSSRLGKTNLPSRACLRHSDKWFGRKP